MSISLQDTNLWGQESKIDHFRFCPFRRGNDIKSTFGSSSVVQDPSPLTMTPHVVQCSASNSPAACEGKSVDSQEHPAACIVRYGLQLFCLRTENEVTLSMKVSIYHYIIH